jgi:hypothetical protein
MPIEDVRVTDMMPGNLVADAGYPLLSETILIDAELPIGSIIAKDVTSEQGSLVTLATEANVFGVLRQTVYNAGTLAGSRVHERLLYPRYLEDRCDDLG